MSESAIETDRVSSAMGGFTAGMALVWLLLVLPAWFAGGFRALEGMSVAGLLCLVPGWLVFGLVQRYRVAKVQAMAVLLGTGLRLAFVGIGYIAVQTPTSGYTFREFTIWLLIMYIAALSRETWQLLRRGAGE